QQNAREEHGTRGGRFGMRVGKPSVQGEERHLDGEGQEEGGEEEKLGSHRERYLAAHEHGLYLRQIKRTAELIEPDHGHEHQNRAEHGVNNEFDRGVDAAFVPPDSDQEVHGDEHGFPEKEEEKKIERNKDADHAGFEHQQADEEAAYALVDGFPGTEDSHGREEGGQQDEEQADAIDAEVIVNRRRGNPVMKFDELVVRGIHGKAANQLQRERKFKKRYGQGDAANPLMIVRAQHPERDGSREGLEGQDGEHVGGAPHSP